MKIELTIWQFVRLMVFIEEHPDTGGGNGLAPLLQEWHDIWQAVDQDLEDLADNDFEAYADMMMDESVVIDDVASNHAIAAADALAEIAKMMQGIIDAGTDEENKENLEFEKSELLRAANNIRNQLQ